jgi:hypothetical protein
MNINEILAAVEKLDGNDKVAVAQRLAASTNRSRGTIVTLAAARENSNKRQFNEMMNCARQLGVVIPEDRPVNLLELDAQLLGKDVNLRFTLKHHLRALGML